MGHKFEQIRFIIDKVEDKSRVGVCIDTCHAYTAGYDIKSPEGYAATFSLFDKTIGFKYLKGMHFNDTKKELASRVDRHDSIGKGLLGDESFRMLMNDSRLDNLPLILETPEESLWPAEIKSLYSLVRK
jgi:deoxyribonuclease IV